LQQQKQQKRKTRVTTETTELEAAATTQPTVLSTMAFGKTKT
jgi:hypothetical protein